MSSKKMGSRKDRYAIVVHNSDDISFDYVTETFQTILGHELTQAANCAMAVHNRGSFIVKSFNDKEHADATVELLVDYELDAEVIDTKKK